jgi:hypothetical protein
MPFDAATLLARQQTLAEMLEQYGIAPVSGEDLDEHKAAQVTAYGPNFWYRHQGLLVLGLLVPVVGAAVTGGIAQSFGQVSPALPWYVSLGWMCLLLPLFTTGVLRLRAGAHWEERWVLPASLDRLGVPPAIAGHARQLQQDAPGSALMLGELVEERAVLDPYLLLVRGTERICLGIWDGDRVIACAE